MCGIIGYVGKRNAVEELLKGLYKLEYRGYDSSGLSVFDGVSGKIVTEKKFGRISNLDNATKELRKGGYTFGIAHTRWATHGKPSDENSHPHGDSKGIVSIVHNGIIENYNEHKKRLIEKGEVFLSETDTEVAAKIIAENYEGDPLKALAKTIKIITGSYAIAAIFRDYPDVIFTAKKDNPLVIGFSEGEKYIASDITAFISRTREYLPLADMQIARVTENSVEVFDENLSPVEYKTMTASWDYESADLGKYSCFMEKEINEQPRVAQNVLSPRIKDDLPDFSSDGIDVARIAASNRIYISACGTAMHAGLFAKNIIERFARIPVDVSIASEFRYSNPILSRDDYSFVISQSGETADTLAALRMLNASGVPTAAIVNVVGSTIAREAQNVLYTNAGPEIAVASTKAYISQALLLALLALAIAKEKKTMTVQLVRKYTHQLATISDVISELLTNSDRIKELAELIKDDESLFFLGRGVDYAAISEASLKLKEISYIHCEAYAAGELKHGTISLISDKSHVIAIATNPELFDKMESNIKEVAARGAYVYLITTEDGQRMCKVANDSYILPTKGGLFEPLLAVIICQILAMYTAKALGFDVDKPRNLAKSVTVE